MNKLKINRPVSLLLTVLAIPYMHATAQADSVPSKEIVKLHYFNSNNSLQYLLLESVVKKGKKLEPQAKKAFRLYLDNDQQQNLIADVVTDQTGKARAFIPVALKTSWDSSGTHTFIVVPEAKDNEGTSSEFTITRTSISIDTSSADGVKNISVRVMKNQSGQWIPVNGVEMKIGVERLGGILSAGDDETYTTDSTGTVTTEFKKDSLPGDQHGSFVLVAKVDDNDELGNLIVEKQVPWGVAAKTHTNFFNQRTLWSTRFKTPFWLLFMAYSIVIAVWGTIIYLVFQIIKIKKLGVAGDSRNDQRKSVIQPVNEL